MINQVETQDNQEKYEPAEEAKYSFAGLKNLSTNIFDVVVQTVTKGRICAYRVNNCERTPFLEYLLLLNEEAVELMFPELHFTEECCNVTNVLVQMNLLLTLILGLNNDKTDYYKGYYIKDNEITIFYDLTNMEIKLNDIYKDSSRWFCLVSEIINSGYMCDLKISTSVSDFLTCETENPFYTLHNEFNKQYESPVVVYSGMHEKKLNFTYIFGVTEKDDSALFGTNYYYFTDFKNSVKRGGWSKTEKPETAFDILLTDNEHGRYVKGGVVRFALFLGKHKVQMNLVTDVTDDSQKRQERLLNNSLDTKYEALLSRITDYDGRWARDYDSIVSYEVELDDGSKLRNAPVYACNDYDHFCSLSYHYLKKSLLGEKYDKTTKYEIM